MRSELRKIGILGGTFNPIHRGHLILAKEAKKVLGLEKVIFIPTNISPHKNKRGETLAPAKERYHMVELAIKHNSCFEVSDIEFERGGVSYSIETIKRLKLALADAKLYFIVGSDFLKEFSDWKDMDELKAICRFAIAPRPGYPLKKMPENMRALKVNAPDISSTDIRKRIKNKQPIHSLVPEEVEKYILKKRLYI